MSWLSVLGLGKRSPKVGDGTVPAIGEEWVIREGDEGPWAPKRRKTWSTILDVKEGWVRYKIGDWFPDERMPLERFVRIYRRR